MTLRTRRLTALAAAAAVVATVGVGASGTVPSTPAVADGAAGERPVTQHDAVDDDPERDTAARTARPKPAVAAANVRRDAPTVSRRTGPVLDEDLRGRAALRAIGGQAAEVAARNGISEQQLVETLREDDTAWVSGTGRVYFQEPMAASVNGPVAGAVSSGNVDTTRTFDLHSRPGATRSIVIDADGAHVSGTEWNLRSSKPLPVKTWPGWNSDGSDTMFTPTEHAWVQEVWRQVSESYAAFDVDVTTDTRDDGAWKRTSSADATYGTRVVITSDPAAAATLCGGTCVGQAYLSTFDRVDEPARYQPAFVFAHGGTMSPVVAAQTVTHETGHTLGLSHDGDAASAYHAGSPLWGPIMGSGMTRAISHWSKGEYAGATQQEDDLALIALKAPLVADEASDTWQSAQALPAAAVPPTVPAAAAYDVDGVISTRTDKDVFKMDLTCATTVTAKATGIGVQAALDLKLDLLDGAGSTLQSDSPDTTMATWALTAGGMDASVSRSLAPGTYYLSVDGVGDDGDTRAKQAAWNDYGSLGRYRLQATGCPTAGPTPTTSPTPTTTPTPSTAPSPSPTTTAPTTPAPTTPAPVVLTRPGTPTVGTASSGASGGTVSATARWTAPTVTGGQAILGYKVRAYKLDSRNRVIGTYTTGRTAANVRTLVYRLPRGRYAFVVLAENGVGASAWSAKSRIVTAR